MKWIKMQIPLENLNKKEKIDLKLEAWAQEVNNLKRTNKFKSSAFFYLQAYAKCSYYTLISPYNIQEINGRELIVKTNPIQKVLCGILNLFSGLSAASWAKWVNDTLSKKSIRDDPSQLYNVALSLASLYAVWAYIYLNFFQRKGLPFLYKAAYQMSKPTHMITKREKVSIWLWGLAIGLFMTFSVMKPVVEISMKNGFHKLYADNENGLFVLKNICFLYPNPNSTGITVQYILSIFTFIFHGYTFLFFYVSGLTIGYFSCFIVYQIGCECVEIFEDGNLSFSQVAEYFMDLRTLFFSINEALGFVMLGMCLNIIAFFSQSFTTVFDGTDIVSRLTNLFYLTVSITCFSLAALGSSKLERFEEYLFENRLKAGFTENMQTLTLSGYISTHPLGLKVFKFHITYGFIVKIFSTVLTYVIVLLQFSVSTCSGNESHVKV